MFLNVRDNFKRKWVKIKIYLTINEKIFTKGTSKTFDKYKD
jgi:hypothetical protein